MMIDPDAAERLLPWHAKALCHPGHGHDPALWFPVVTTGGIDPGRRAEATAPAKAICAQCPVRRECLAYARNDDQRHGVWGGVDFETATKEPARPECGTDAGYFHHRRQHEAICSDCRGAHNRANRKRGAA